MDIEETNYNNLDYAHSTKLLNIGIVDDHLIIRETLRIQFKNSYNIVLEAGDGSEMIDLITKYGEIHMPEIVLIDTEMPGINGFEAANWLKENKPAVKVIAYSGNNDPESIRRMRECGAISYLSKSYDSFKGIKEAIEIVKSKKYYYPSYIAHILLSNEKGSVEKKATTDKNDNKRSIKYLTEREKKIIQMVGDEKSGKEIADELEMNPRSVENIINALFVKFNIKTRVGLAVYAQKNGLLS